MLASSLILQADKPQPPGLLNPDQMLIAIIVATAMLLVVIELVRKRKLREEYAFLWIGTAMLLTILALWTNVLDGIRAALGAQTQASTLFFGAILFLMLLALQFSVHLTRLTSRNKALGQEVSLLRRELDDLRDQIADDTVDEGAPQTRDREMVAPTERHPSD